MKIAGSYPLPAHRDRVWALLMDPGVIRRTVPGCEEFKTEGQGVFRTTIRTGIANLRGNLMEVEIRLEDAQAPEHYRLVFHGKGMGSFVDGHADMDLIDADTDTEVRYSGEVAVGGMIASVGNRVLDVAARKAVNDFFERVQREIEPQEAEAQEAGAQ